MKLMPRSWATQGLLLAGALMVASTFVDAQFGGLIRRGTDALRGTETPPEPQPSAQQPESSQADPFANPDIVPITADQVERFNKALQYEIDKTEELIALLASQKSPEEYQQCAGTVLGSPEALQLIQDFADKSADLPVEQMLRNQQAMYAEQAAMVAKRCGTERWSVGKRTERLQEIEAEASDVAMPPGWQPKAAAALSPGGNPLSPSAFGHPRVLASVRPSRRPRFSALPPAAQIVNPLNHPFVRAYAMLKERIPKFCVNWSEEQYRARTTRPSGVHQVPGESAAVWYVYTEQETAAFTRERCSVTLNLYPQVPGGSPAARQRVL